MKPIYVESYTCYENVLNTIAHHFSSTLDYLYTCCLRLEYINYAINSNIEIQDRMQVVWNSNIAEVLYDIHGITVEKRRLRGSDISMDLLNEKQAMVLNCNTQICPWLESRHLKATHYYMIVEEKENESIKCLDCNGDLSRHIISLNSEYYDIEIVTCEPHGNHHNLQTFMHQGIEFLFLSETYRQLLKLGCDMRDYSNVLLRDIELYDQNEFMKGLKAYRNTRVNFMIALEYYNKFTNRIKNEIFKDFQELIENWDSLRLGLAKAWAQNRPSIEWGEKFCSKLHFIAELDSTLLKKIINTI